MEMQTGDMIGLALALNSLMLAALVLSFIRRNQGRIARRARDEARLSRPDSHQTPVEEAQRHGARLLRTAARLADRIPLFDSRQRRKFTDQLLTAGFRHPLALQLFIAAKVAMGGGAALLAAIMTGHAPTPLQTGVGAVALVLGGLVAGLLLPEALLSLRISRRRTAIDRAVPDLLDLLVICTNAGYSLGASIRRISGELHAVSPELAAELTITADDISVHADPATGLRNLARRTGVTSLGSMATTLIHSQRYGTPITQSLRTLARTERRARILAMEEKGAKLSTKITIPMMVLILPGVFLLIAGPTFLNIVEAFGK
ncbi:MAG: type II secretion system F family protein [Telmatospirillum sp.]|nr:type II secretion system F family protein [Telmatospirillum sp.]